MPNALPDIQQCQSTEKINSVGEKERTISTCMAHHTECDQIATRNNRPRIPKTKLNSHTRCILLSTTQLQNQSLFAQVRHEVTETLQ